MAYICYGMAVLCTVYCGGVVLTRAAGTKFYLIWLFLAAFFAGAGLFFQKGLWSRMPAGIRTAFLAVAGACAVWFLFVEGLILSGFGAKAEPGLSYLVVLGAQMKEDGPSVVLARRLDAAADYLFQNPQTVCVVSGGKGNNEPVSEAAGMYAYLVEKGVEPERILLEDRSANTLQNLRFSRELIPVTEQRVGIVTSNFHVYRSRQLARAQGFSEAVGIASTSGVYFLPNNMLREFFGLMKDRLAGNLRFF